MTIGDVMLLAAGTMHIWVPPVEVMLFGIAMVALHLWASLMQLGDD